MTLEESYTTATPVPLVLLLTTTEEFSGSKYYRITLSAPGEEGRVKVLYAGYNPAHALDRYLQERQHYEDRKAAEAKT